MNNPGTTLPFVNVEEVDAFLTTFLGTAGDDSYDFTGILFYLSGPDMLGALGLRVGGGNDTVTVSGMPVSANGHAVSGEAGSDLLNGAAMGDRLGGGLGDDTVHGGGGADTLSGANGFDSFTGGNSNDTLLGLNGSDFLNGGAGNDSMAGGLGADRYAVDTDKDLVLENPGEGNDTVIATVNLKLGDNIEGLVLGGGADLGGIANALANRMTGNGGNNHFSGLDGNDVLLGLDGADTLYGGPGGDLLTGGAGNDRFQFTLPGDGTDRITDFTPGEDLVVMQGLNFGALPAGALNPANFVAHASNAATSPFGTPQFIYHTTLGIFSFDADGLGGSAALRLAVFTGAPAITAADILII